jgi:hypothetical protein
MHLQYDQDDEHVVEHYQPLQGPQGRPMLVEGLTGPSGATENWSWVVPGLDIKLDAMQTALIVGTLLILIIALYMYLRPQTPDVSAGLPGPRPLSRAEEMMSRQLSMEALSRRAPLRKKKAIPKKVVRPKAAKKASPKKAAAAGGSPKKIIVEM